VDTPITATTTHHRPALRIGGFELVALAVVAAAVLTVFIWSQVVSTDDVTVQGQSYGVGYPAQGGLAGPARVSVWEQHGFAAGYPTQGGLAGPSSAGSVGTISAVDIAALDRTGYPLHGGLAGPTRVVLADHAGSFAPGYPLQGGLAGPSQLDGGE